jgi:hypothetical protein
MKTTSYFRLVAFVLAVAALHASPVAADSNPPVLIVPGCRAMLHIAVNLPEGLQAGTAWQLTEIGKPGAAIAVQTIAAIADDGTEHRGHARLLANVPAADDLAKTRHFRLQRAATGAIAPAFTFSDDSPASLRIAEQNRPVLVYNHGVITDQRVPTNDTRRSRACYIHPLWGLNGEVLTDDFPKDHYHHHGVFWAWPHVDVGGEKRDLWEYKDIAQRFVRWLGRDAGPLAAVLGVENGWFVGDRKVMIERVWIQPAKATSIARALDLDFTWIPVDRPIALRGAEGKSYGGLTVRFAVANEKDSTITVPAGASPNDLPDTPLPWADLTCKFAGAEQPSGAAIFIPRDHPNYPPTWLTRHYGALCVGWPGVKGKTFKPGEPIHLRYRVWIHAGAVDVAALKAADEAYLSESGARWE